jgi:hypothetical protein
LKKIVRYEMKKRLFVCLCALVLTFGMVRFAQALPYDFDMGGNSSVDTSGTNDVLQMYANVNPILGNIGFSLDIGQSSNYIYFATFGTTEGWINRDDINPGDITAKVDFDNPNLLQAIEGTSVGFTGGFSFIQGWNIKWNDPVYVETVDGLKFSIDLTNVGYSSWFWQGPDGEADVYAKITLISESNANLSSVPDAGIMWLLGPAFIALGLLGRKKNRTNNYKHHIQSIINHCKNLTVNEIIEILCDVGLI